MPLINITVDSQISASPEVVFEFMTDTRNMPLWNNGMSTVTPSLRLAQGLTYYSTTSVMGHTIKSENLITRLIPNTLLVITNAAPPLIYTATFTYSPSGQGTLLTCNLEIRGASSLIQLAKPVLEYLAQTRMEGDFATLKAIIENQGVVRTEIA